MNSMKMTCLFLALVAGTTSGFVGADDISAETIRRMVNNNEILPLLTIMEAYPESTYGQLLDLEVESEHGKIVYELEFLRSDGLVIELKVDARNGALIEQEIDD